MGVIPLENANLYFRDLGQGKPIILLHGGPDFNYDYFLPDMDRLSDAFRLIYYDQRGRGRSSVNVQPEDISIESEIADFEALREYFRLESCALLGHSWGGLLALEYAIHHPGCVSHLILLNTAPVSHEDYLLLRQDRRERAADDIKRLKAIASTAGFQHGELDSEVEYYRIHFSKTIRQAEQLEKVVKRLRVSFTSEDILKAREIEGRLYSQTWFLSGYNLLPLLMQLNVPTLIIHGDHDIIPVECAVHIAQAIPASRLVLLPETGHFSFLEDPDGVRREIIAFYQDTA